jgi:hypothetical protein
MTGVIAGVGCALLSISYLQGLQKLLQTAGSIADRIAACYVFFPVAVILPFAFMVPSEIHIMESQLPRS